MRRFFAGLAFMTLAACSFSEDQSIVPDYKLHGQVSNIREYGVVVSVDQDAHVAAHNMGSAAAGAAGNTAGTAAASSLSGSILSPVTGLMSSAGSVFTSNSQSPTVGMETQLHYVIRKDDGTVINLDQVPEDGDTIVYPGQRVMLQTNGDFTRIYPADMEHRRGADN